MEPNIRIFRWVIQLKIEFTQRLVTIRIYGLISQYDSVIITRLNNAAIIQHEKRKTNMQNNYANMQNMQNLHAFNITAYYWGLEFWIWAALNLWMTYSRRQINQSHYKLGENILIDQFSGWNYGKKYQSYKNINNYAAGQVLILAKCVSTFWSSPP